MKSLEQEIKQSKFSNPIEKAVVNILYTAKILESEVKDILAESGITNPQYNILRILNGSDPKPLSPGDIKEVMLFKGSDLTRLLDRLFDKGLVLRIVCPSNRRMVEVNISDEGKNILEVIKPKLDILFSRMQENFDLKEADKLNGLLDKLRSYL